MLTQACYTYFGASLLSDLTSSETSTDPQFLRLRRLAHWMYGLQALGLGLAMLFAWTTFGAALVGWPAILAMLLYRRESKAALAYPFLASHFDWLNRSFWTCAIWLGTLILLYFILVGTFFNGALIAVGLFGTLRTGWGWLMLGYGRQVRRRRTEPAKHESTSQDI